MHPYHIHVSAYGSLCSIILPLWLEINHFIAIYVLSLLIVNAIIHIHFIVIFIIINIIFLMQGNIRVSWKSVVALVPGVLTVLKNG